MTTKASKTKNKAAQPKASAPARSVTVGGKASAIGKAVTLKQLQAEAEKLPKLIRPQYDEFNVPSDPDGETVIIKKIPIGPRDGITEAANASGEVDTGVFADHVIFNSLVRPELTLEQLNLLDPADYNMIYAKSFELSYLEVEKVVKTFPSGTDG